MDCTVCSYVIYKFQSGSTLSSCLNVNELLAQNKHNIWSLSDCNRTRTHNHLICKWTLNHSAKRASLATWLTVCLWTKLLWIWVLLQSWDEALCKNSPWGTIENKMIGLETMETTQNFKKFQSTIITMISLNVLLVSWSIDLKIFFMQQGLIHGKFGGLEIPP